MMSPSGYKPSAFSGKQKTKNKNKPTKEENGKILCSRSTGKQLLGVRIYSKRVSIIHAQNKNTKSRRKYAAGGRRLPMIFHRMNLLPSLCPGKENALGLAVLCGDVERAVARARWPKRHYLAHEPGARVSSGKYCESFLGLRMSADAGSSLSEEASGPVTGVLPFSAGCATNCLLTLMLP